jgi:hypothetical protein
MLAKNTGKVVLVTCKPVLVTLPVLFIPVKFCGTVNVLVLVGDMPPLAHPPAMFAQGIRRLALIGLIVLLGTFVLQ